MSKPTKNINSLPKAKNDSNVSEDAMNNPEVLARMQGDMDIRLNAIKNYAQLPADVKRRVRALKNYQLDIIKIEESFFRELSLLESRFSDQYQSVYNKRKEVVNGSREPTDLECDFKAESVSELSDQFNSKIEIASEDIEKEVPSTETVLEKGIPDFWLKVLQHSDSIRVNIQEKDIDILKYLIDIKCILKSGDDNGFVLEFYFKPNPYFSDEKLTKEYFIRICASADSPFSYEGPEIDTTKGCQIHWFPSKNVTIKLVKKVQKSKNRSEKRTVTKVIKNESFFNFFDPPLRSLCDDDLEEEERSVLEADFEMGQYLRERIIPRAVLYYTGESLDNEFGDLDDDDDSDDDASDENSDVAIKGNNGTAATGEQKPECKQQ